ncbi:hypothetical protein FSP39_017971 [Pinctada imbricata]|uniref:Uncharacterized protein n=1 Tax=Pinctada imbricata TaxID=66713 RepID=A0AA88XT67_PINIB|nr:hypothetical protein FSP39_017971 [Pinctada imbricata]
MIQKKGGTIDKSHKSHILYTRPYDFMDVSDRNEMLEFLFWLGYVQSSAYKALHIQKV